MREIYTTAPADYDYSWTEQIEAKVATSKDGRKIWRRVAIPSNRVDHQCGRYASGLHAAVPPTEFAKLIDFGLVQTRTVAS